MNMMQSVVAKSGTELGETIALHVPQHVSGVKLSFRLCSVWLFAPSTVACAYLPSSSDLSTSASLELSTF